MIKIISASLFFVIASLGVVFGQEQCAPPYPAEPQAYSTTSSICPGQSISVFVCPGTDCGILSNYSWTFIPAPDPGSTSGTNTASAHGTWSSLGSYGQVAATVSYSCSTGGAGSKVVYVTVYPTATISLTSNTTPAAYNSSGVPEFCGGLYLNALVNNEPSLPNYTFSIDDTVWVYSQTSAQTFLSKKLAPGTHTATVVANFPQSGDTPGCYTPASASYTFIKLPDIQPTLTLNGPMAYCPNNPASYHVTISNAYGGTPNYTWNIAPTNPGTGKTISSDGSLLSFTTLTSGLTAYVSAAVQFTASHPQPLCYVDPNNSNTVNTQITSPVTPTLNMIIADRDSQTPNYYCTGNDPITFTVTGSNLYGPPTYKWTLDGYTLSSTTSTVVVPTGKVASQGVYGPNSTISVVASGFSGACFSSDPQFLQAGPISRSGVTLNFTPKLTATWNPATCSGIPVSIGLGSDTQGTTYTWTATPNSVTGSSSQTTPVSTTAITQTLTVSSGFPLGTIQYVITPMANGCTGTGGNAATVNMVVNATPSVPTFTPSNIFPTCGVSNVLMSAQVGTYGTEVHWYDPLGNYLGNTNSINPYVTANANYSALSYNASTSCQSASVTAQVVIDNRYNAPVNSIIEQDALIDGMTVTSNLSSQPIQNVQEKVQYFDGLGRHYQDVMINASPLQNDLVQTSVYDQYGREYLKYLPVAVGSDGCPKNNIIDSNGNYTGPALNFYNNGLTDKIADDSKPFSQTFFESSPLNRVMKQGAPGLTWQPDSNPASRSDHTVKHSYEYNGPTDVIYFTYNTTTGLVSTGSGGNVQYYGANLLLANRTTDEHQNDVIEYVDKLGHTICKKVQYSSSGTQLFASTYYIYDDFGNLIVVLPPQAIQSALATLTSQN